MSDLKRRIWAVFAALSSGTVFALSSCIERVPPEWVECLRTCNP